MNLISRIYFKDSAKRERISDITKQAFGLHFTLDRTGKMLCIRMNSEKPTDKELEEGNHKKACEYHKNGILITDSGDGVKHL